MCLTRKLSVNLAVTWLSLSSAAAATPLFWGTQPNLVSSFFQWRSQCNVITTDGTIYHKDGLRTIFIPDITPIICIIILMGGEPLTRHRAKNKKVNNNHCLNGDILTMQEAGTRSVCICIAYMEEVNKHITG